MHTTKRYDTAVVVVVVAMAIDNSNVQTNKISNNIYCIVCFCAAHTLLNATVPNLPAAQDGYLVSVVVCVRLVCIEKFQL